MKKVTMLIILLVATSSLSLYSQKNDPPPEIGIVEHLGDQLPLDLEFTDSEGNVKKLRDIITKPTVFSLVYYNCPGICSPLLTSMSEVMDRVELEPGQHFQALTISFDHREGPDKAKKWKENYLASMQRKFGDDNWTFMVGDSVSIRTLTDAVGFYFKPDGIDYVHAATLMVLTPDGKLSRYLLGTQFNPFDLKMSITEAAEGKSMPTITKILQFCYNYDPEGKTYVFNVTKVAGVFIFFGVGVFVAILVLAGKSKKSRQQTTSNEGGNKDE